MFKNELNDELITSSFYVWPAILKYEQDSTRNVGGQNNQEPLDTL